RRINGHLHQLVALLERERGRLAGGSVHEDAVRAVLDLELDQARVGVVIHFALAERRHQRRHRPGEEIALEADHAAAALGCASKPGSVPRTSGACLRSSCQSSDSMKMFRGWSWMVSSYT